MWFKLQYLMQVVRNRIAVVQANTDELLDSGLTPVRHPTTATSVLVESVADGSTLNSRLTQ